MRRSATGPRTGYSVCAAHASAGGGAARRPRGSDRTPLRKRFRFRECASRHVELNRQQDGTFKVNPISTWQVFELMSK